MVTLFAIGDTLYRFNGLALVKAGKRNYKQATEYTDDDGRKWIFNQQTRRWGLHPDSKKQKKSSGKSKQKTDQKPKQATQAAPTTQLSPKNKQQAQAKTLKPKAKSSPTSQQSEVKPKTAKEKKQKELQKKVPVGKPKLVGQDWNPNAIKDLHPSEFAEKFIGYQESFDEQNDPEAIWNKSRSESGLSSFSYKQRIIDAVDRGFIPSDQAISDAKLSKGVIKQIEQNRAFQAQASQQMASIQKAVDTPISVPGAENWKPQMSREEAAQYLNDSFFGTISFYHGNWLRVTDSIANSGADPKRNKAGVYGQGVYFGVDKRTAELYASSRTNQNDPNNVNAQTFAPVSQEKPQVGLVEVYVKASNPYIATSEEFDRMAEYLGDTDRGEISEALSQYLRARGYDSVYVQDLGYIVAMDTRQVVTVSNEDLTPRWDELNQALYAPRRDLIEGNKNAERLSQLTGSDRGRNFDSSGD